MKDEPLVSAIINCYNGEKYLREAIDSVMNQTYKNLEIVFWDNQSTDSSREIVESYNSDKIHYYYAPEHKDLGEARNQAVKVASGEYVAFLDCDDLWLPHKISTQVEMLDINTKVVFSPFDIICEGESPILLPNMIIAQKRCLKFAGKSKNFYNILLKGNFICVSSILIKKDLFIQVEGIDSSIRHNADYDLLIKASLKTNFACTEIAGIKYRIHPMNLSNKTYLCGYYENRLIFNRCPYSKKIEKVKRFNETHIVLHEMYGKNNFYLILKSIIKNGSLYALFYIVYRKLRVFMYKYIGEIALRGL